MEPATEAILEDRYLLKSENAGYQYDENNFNL